jgi:hypothetical protein
LGILRITIYKYWVWAKQQRDEIIKKRSFNYNNDIPPIGGTQLLAATIKRPHEFNNLKYEWMLHRH